MATQKRNIQARKEYMFNNVVRCGASVIVFDTETTGIGKNAKIIQFSGVKYRINERLQLKEENRMDIYINPEEPLNNRIIELTGITDKKLKDKENERDVVNEIFDFLESGDIWAGYNVSFDIRMLRQMSERTGVMLDETVVLDVIEMARDFIYDTSDYKLGTISGYLFPDLDFKFHSAIDDAVATACILQVMLRKYYNYEETDGYLQKVHLERGYYWINPHKKSQARVNMVLNIGEKGDIYYDLVTKRWSAKTTKSAQRIFKDLDIYDLERQFREKYCKPYGYASIDEAAKAWAEYRKQNN